MGNWVPDRAPRRRRTVLYAVGAAGAVLLFVAGFAFVNSVSVSRVTENARALHWNNSTLGVSALARAGLVQAVTFSELHESEIVAREEVDFAMDQATNAAAELRGLASVAGDPDAYPELSSYSEEVEATLDLLRAGAVDQARENVLARVEPAYIDLSTALVDDQAEIQAAIDENTAAGQTVNGWVVFVVTLAVPASAIAAYFIVARRQIRAAEERTQIEVEAEREIGRAKDTFIAGLSHELRTPLTSISGFAELLSQGEVHGVEATRETAQIIVNESAEMRRMIDDLLAACRLESTGLEVEVTDARVDDVIEAAVAPFERAGVEVSRQPTSQMARTDPMRLRHVLVNLISNAVRHGGPDIRVVAATRRGMLAIDVVDNGPGIPEERVGEIYRPFVNDGASSLLAGSVGLGLAVAKRVTNLLGGGLEYHRHAGNTHFVVTIPVGLVAGASDDGAEPSALSTVGEAS